MKAISTLCNNQPISNIKSCIWISSIENETQRDNVLLFKKDGFAASYFITYSNTFGAQCSQSPDKQKLRATRRDEKKGAIKEEEKA